ncbi:chromosome partitioning protein ParB [Bifidobacterium sp. DSM 109958]|uniref:Chromosome partitioning protein ParB n=1 Tax=Bifidobacterium moraviense TaxID=2675323 RepID=A0A7Y0F325_9BIFI|nr:ParB/RepB/Spo0J family partition protein [Bifidobacterium sp. DSM 109958]NMN01016.1 chromosome partitioning protein ParB [Bifidobacterium sp. DSM 109958]
MATRPRLGKGLGALFPSLPGEQEQQEKPKDVVRPVDGTAAAASPAAAATGSTHDVSRETSASAGEPTGERAGGSEASAKRHQRASAKRARASVPALGDLTHPSDMFFGSDASGAADAVPSSGASPSKHDREIKSAFDMTLDDLLKPSPKSLRAVVAGEQADGESSADAASASHDAQDARNVAGTTAAGESAHDDAETSEKAAQEQLKPVVGGYLAELNVSDIGPNLHQPRAIFDEDDLMELSDSIKEVGVLQPIVVRRRPKHQIDVSRETSAAQSEEQKTSNPFAGRMDSPYELIMGERRWRATQLAGLTTIPAIVKTTADDDMLRDALLENLHRVALNPLEEAAAYQQMIKEFGLTQEQLSKSVSKSRPQIANTLRLLQLPPSVQKKVAAGVLSAGHARALLGLDSEEDMDKLAVRIVSEGLSVRSTEEIVAMMTMDERQKAKPAAKRRANVWSGSAIQQSLENRFETKVAIKGTKKHGRIEITFSSPEDMDRILAMLNPDHASDSSTADDGWV